MDYSELLEKYKLLEKENDVSLITNSSSPQEK
jgi:hypothetical protein